MRYVYPDPDTGRDARLAGQFLTVCSCLREGDLGRTTDSFSMLQSSSIIIH